MKGKTLGEIQEAVREGRADFSRWHPLDHRPWECWKRNKESPIYGRALVHIEYELEYRTDLGLLGDIIRWLLRRGHRG